MIDKTYPGTLYKTEHGLSRVKFYIGSPSITMEVCENGETFGGGTTGLMWDNVKQVDTMDKDELLELVDIMAVTMHTMRTRSDIIEKELIDAKRKLSDMELKALLSENEALRALVKSNG